MGKAFVCVSVQRYVNLFTSHPSRFSTLKSPSNSILLLYTSHDCKMAFVFSYQPLASKVVFFAIMFSIVMSRAHRVCSFNISAAIDI